MNLNLKATNFELEEKTRDFVEKKAGIMVEKFSKKTGVDWRVEIEIERVKKHSKGDVFRAEMQIIFPGAAKGIRAEGNGATWRQAIDKANQRARREIRDFKEKKLKS